MKKPDPSAAQQIAQAAIAFQQQRTGHEPQPLAVVLSGDTLLITQHGATAGRKARATWQSLVDDDAQR